MILNIALCQSKDIINEYLKFMSEHFNIPAEILPAMIAVESSYNQKAISPLGAVGLLQITRSAFIDFTNKTRYEISFNDVKSNWVINLTVGAWYLYHRCYKIKGNWKDAITSYFWGSWSTNMTDCYYKKVKKRIKK